MTLGCRFGGAAGEDWLCQFGTDYLAGTGRAYPEEDRRLPVPHMHRRVPVVRDAPRDHISEYLQVLNRIEPVLDENRLKVDFQRPWACSGMGPALTDRVHVTLWRPSAYENGHQRTTFNILLIWMTLHVWLRRPRESQHVL